MIMPMFLSKRQLQEYLGIPANKVISLLAKHGVHPIDLGKGRGYGLRWKTSAVTKILDAVCAEAQPAAKTPRRPKVPQHCLKDRSVDEVYADLSKGNPLQ